ncbi:hypothetical protein GR212_25210 [Rhizobium lusitanum]|uniref:Uncharacterized protein n=1 Tax=Rhizobium lusitanum TaxID=293958 RepID=A0A6L9UA17_9HYPH|nr:hypothetical protein [Rhizobium lusitanum]NEI72865.1 hypothetical protein [Rhizobium lusitanum]
MSSNIYPPCVSRNLVQTGSFGYRENTTLRLAVDTAIPAGARINPSMVNFTVFPDFGMNAEGKSARLLKRHPCPRDDVAAKNSTSV